MSLDRLDTFNRANNPLNTGAPWTYQNLTGISVDTAVVDTNRLHSTDVAFNDNFYRAEIDNLSADHEAQITWAAVTLSGALDVGLHVLCRLDTNNAAPTGYLFAHSVAGGQQIFKIVAGTFTLLSQLGSATPANGDVLKGGCSGSTLTLTLNGTPSSISDGSIASGLRCGFDIFRETAAVDVFGEDFQFGPTVVTPFVRPTIVAPPMAISRASRW